MVVTPEGLTLESRPGRARRTELARLAYATTLAAPEQVKPDPRVFLEFAPIHRIFDAPLDAEKVSENQKHVELLEANLKAFPPETARALEYWLDCSPFYQWKAPHVKLPWSEAVLRADLDGDGKRGVGHITSFGVYPNEEDLRAYGAPLIEEYGRALRQWRPERL